jgi:hypothetical protein
MILRQKNHTDALVLKVKAEGQERRNVVGSMGE